MAVYPLTGSYNSPLGVAAGPERYRIDPIKCPCVLQEFLEWEYEVAPDGTVLGTLMDANDHGIDAARYACSRIWQRKGA